MSEPPGPKLKDNFGLGVRKLYRWTRPCFSLPPDRRLHRSGSWHALMERRFRFSGHVFNAPTHQPEPFSARFLGPGAPGNSEGNSRKFRAKKSITAAVTGRRSGHFGTHLEATGGTQTHARRTRSKLRQLHCTRQALVRVPESNTKYGGKGRKTGVAPRPWCRQVSVSPQGFPSEKIIGQWPIHRFTPLFTGEVFLIELGLL